MAAPQQQVIGKNDVDLEAGKHDGDSRFFKIPFQVGSYRACACLPCCPEWPCCSFCCFGGETKHLTLSVLEPSIVEEVPKWLSEKGLRPEVWAEAMCQLQQAILPVHRLEVKYPIAMRALWWLLGLPLLLACVYGQLYLVYVLLLGLLNLLTGCWFKRRVEQCFFERTKQRVLEADSRLRQWQEELNRKLRPLGLFCKTQSFTKTELIEKVFSEESSNYKVFTVQRFVVFAHTNEAITQLQEEPHVTLELQPDLKDAYEELLPQLVLDFKSMPEEVLQGMC